MSCDSSTTPATRRISDRLFVSAQPSLTDLAGLAGRGFGAVISNRPAHEDADQPDPADERRATEAAGMRFRFIPVTTATITDADVRSFQEAMAATGSPVLAHCKTGIRSANLYAIGEALDGRIDPAALPALGAQWGIDLSLAARWLATDEGRQPRVKGFFHPHTSSIQYIATDRATRRCAVIDPVLDFDETSGAVSTESADLLLSHIAAERLTVDWIIDTHAHADHFSAAHYLHGKTDAPTAIGAGIADAQRLWRSIYNSPALSADGAQWHHLFEAGERFKVGSIDATILFSPGHTPASVTPVIGDAAFVHDTFLMPDSGTARADFPGGSARDLWRSLQAILELPDKTRLFVGHDYQPDGRTPRWESSVGVQRSQNPHVVGLSQDEFVTMRESRDRTLPLPQLMLHALQVNIAGGRLPPLEDNGQRYLRIPINARSMPAWRGSP